VKISRPIVYGGIGVVAVAAYLWTAPAAPKASSKPKSSSLKPKAQDSEFTAEDYSRRYEPYTQAAKNVFMPAGGSSAGTPLQRPDAIPPSFAANERDWMYTGTAEIDSVPVALFESAATREGVFLKQGEHWKSSVVMQIGPDFVVLAGADGETYRVKLIPYDMAAAAGPLDVSSAASRAVNPDVTVTPEQNSLQPMRRGRNNG